MLRKKLASTKPKDSQRASDGDLESIVDQLKRLGTKKVREGMARFAIPSEKAFGVPVGEIRKYAKRLGQSHELAAALWETPWYEVRMLACFVDDPARVTPEQMDRWCQDFDSWAICDTACFHLFDRTPHAFRKVLLWSRRKPEFEKRAAFALLASIALHDKQAPDEPFAKCLPLAERAATDPRNFVKKGVVWALRGVGGRNPALYAAAIGVAERLAKSTDPTARWVGKTTLRELNSAAATRRLAKQRRAKR
jgi:3-methyladenine DNA glycosylase AlkD